MWWATLASMLRWIWPNFGVILKGRNPYIFPAFLPSVLPPPSCFSGWSYEPNFQYEDGACVLYITYYILHIVRSVSPPQVMLILHVLSICTGELDPMGSSMKKKKRVLHTWPKGYKMEEHGIGWIKQKAEDLNICLCTVLEPFFVFLMDEPIGSFTHVHGDYFKL